MARLHFVKKAAKSYRKQGIHKGHPYWWYTTPKPRIRGARGVKVRCANRPPRSAYATRSEFVGAMMDAEDDLQACHENAADVAERVRALGQDCQEKKDNLESAFPNGCPTIDLLQSRIEACERIANEIDEAVSISQTYGDNGDESEKLRAEVESVCWDYE